MSLADDLFKAILAGRKEGAERERRRIRRAQISALKEVRGFVASVPVQGKANAYTLLKIHELDAATRAPRAKRRRGK